jgi:hypothetical protein
MSADPTAFGKALCSDLKGVWHYCIVVLVVAVGHRATVCDG